MYNKTHKNSEFSPSVHNIIIYNDPLFSFKSLFSSALDVLLGKQALVYENLKKKPTKPFHN